MDEGVGRWTKVVGRGRCGEAVAGRSSWGMMVVEEEEGLLIVDAAKSSIGVCRRSFRKVNARITYIE
jgi:hypothetical protein